MTEDAAIEDRAVEDRGPGDHERLGPQAPAPLGMPVAGRTPDQQAVAMLAACLGYHQREEKPFWWAHFDRLISDPDEWTDRRSTFVADSVSVIEPWHVPAGKKAARRLLRMVGRIEPGSDLRAGAQSHQPAAAPGAAEPAHDFHDIRAAKQMFCCRHRSAKRVGRLAARRHKADGVITDEAARMLVPGRFGQRLHFRSQGLGRELHGQFQECAVQIHHAPTVPNAVRLIKNGG